MSEDGKRVLRTAGVAVAICGAVGGFLLLVSGDVEAAVGAVVILLALAWLQAEFYAFRLGGGRLALLVLVTYALVYGLIYGLWLVFGASLIGSR